MDVMSETTTTVDQGHDPYAGWQPEFATMFTDGKPDALMVPLIESLRTKGLVTHNSCQGHGVDECVRDHDQRRSICWHPGYLAVDARTLDPSSALRIEGPMFNRIECMTYPRFVWTFRWDAAGRDEAIERLFGLKVMKSNGPSTRNESGEEDGTEERERAGRRERTVQGERRGRDHELRTARTTRRLRR